MRLPPPTESESAVVRLERLDQVASVTIDRPRARHAINADVSAGIGAALEEAEADPDFRALVLTRTGDALRAGADLKVIGSGEPVFDPDHSEWGFAGYVQHCVSVPTIAAVNGFALGGGTEPSHTGDSIDAETAVAWGLANRVSTAGMAVEEALGLARRTLGSGWDNEPWQVNSCATGRALRSEDCREGTRAFAEKRQPVWTGR